MENKKIKTMQDYAEEAWYWWEESVGYDDDYDDYDEMARSTEFEDYIAKIDDESLAGIAGIDLDTDFDSGIELAAELRKFINRGFNSFNLRVIEDRVAMPEIFDIMKESFDKFCKDCDKFVASQKEKANA